MWKQPYGSPQQPAAQPEPPLPPLPMDDDGLPF